MLEDAVRGPLARDHLLHLQAALGQRDHLARLDLADQLGADDVEGAALGGDDEALGWPSAAFILPSESGRTPWGSRKATTACLVITTVEKAPSSRGITSATASSIQLVALAGALGEQRRDDLRVRGAAQLDPGLAQLVVELDRVGQVAVVGERELAAVVAPDRLGVLPGAAARGRVADVADRHVAR